MPFAYRTPSHLKLLFAFTAEEYAYRVPGLRGCPVVRLKELDDEALEEIFRTISEVYSEAYDDFSNDHAVCAFDDLIDTVGYGGSRTRRLVKGTVEALDLGRFNGGG